MSQTLPATAESVTRVDPEPAATIAPPSTGLYAYGGVGFEILVERGGAWPLNDEHLRYTAPASTAGVCAHVRVAASMDATLSADGPQREIAVRWQGESAEVRTREVRAKLLRVRPGCYAASASVSPQNGGSSLTTALVGAVVQDVGGVILHASGVIVDGLGVLFVGPSGAGKTTACNHTRGVHAFARDRAAVYGLADGQWLAWGMAGGDPVDLPAAPPGPVPLAAILRVNHGSGTPAIDDVSGARAVSILRESLQSLRDGDELRTLAVLENVRASVRVGVASTVLGHDLAPTLRAWLST